MKLNLTKLVLTAGLSLGIISVASVAEAGINLNGSSLTGHLPQPTTKWQPQQSKGLTSKGSSLSEVVRHGAPPAKYLKGLTKLKEFLRGELAIFPDAYETIHFVIAEGEMVAAYLGFHGTQTGKLGSFPPSGKTLKTDFMCIFRFENSKISEIWALWDRLEALERLGHLAIN